jgi:hypothetical protein
MVSEIVIHLGDCKTGTTALQSVLAGGLARAQDGRRILYPTQFNHMPLAKSISGLKGDADQARYRAPRWSEVARALRASDATWGILSAEHFEFAPPQAVQAALDEFLPGWRGRTRLVAYVRPHPERIVSAYAESLKKTGQPLPMDRFLRSREKGGAEGAGLYGFHPRFTAWRTTFGDAFTLRPYIRDRLAGRDVVTDFLDWLGGPDSFTFQRGSQDNQALGLADLALMRLMHERVLAALPATARGGPSTRNAALHKARMQLGWNFAPFLNARAAGLAPGPDQSGGGNSGGRLRMDRALYDRVVAQYRGDARALDHDFFGQLPPGPGGHGPMESALLAYGAQCVDQPQSLTAADHFSPGEIALARVFSDFTARLIAAEPAHFSWASKPPEERRATFEPTLTQGLRTLTAPGGAAQFWTWLKRVLWQRLRP